MAGDLGTIKRVKWKKGDDHAGKKKIHQNFFVCP